MADLLRAAQGGRGGILLVKGESGIGKSRLLAEAVEAATEGGFVSSRGVADESDRLAPLKPLISTLGEPTRTLVASRGTMPTDMFWLSLVEELQAHLEERTAHGPTLVTLDDLQWADPTTVLALRSLMPELASYPLVWILSRTTGIGGPGVVGLYEALERDGVKRLVLEGLDESAVVEVITDVFGAEPTPELLTLAAGAAGNPFMLIELLVGLRDEGAVEISDGHVRLVSRQLPSRMQEIVRSRLGRLSSPTRHLLQVAAILGRSFDASDLADMLGESPTRLLAELEEAEATGVVVQAGERLTFRHDLLWQTLTEALTVSVAQALHRQAGEMLLKRGRPAILAAGHLARCVRPHDTAALTGLDRAAQEVLPSSPQTAADLATHVLNLTAPSAPERFDRTVTALYALAAAGRLTEVADLARTALNQTTPPAQVAHLHYVLSYILLLAGRPTEAVTEAEKALSGPDLSAELRGLAEQVLFRGMFAGDDGWRGHERAQAIVAAAERHTPPARASAHA